MAKSTCRDCNRTVILVDVGGESLAVDPELIKVVPARQVFHNGADQPRVRMAASETLARRLHAERCESYRESDRKAALQAEMRAYNQQNGRPARAPRRNRGL